MKGLVGVKDDDWFACVTLLKPDWPKAQGSRLTAIRSHWAEIRIFSGRRNTRSCSVIETCQDTNALWKV